MFSNEIITDTQIDAYAYGIELLFSMLINVFSVVILSAVFFSVKTGIIFLLAFIPLRATGGGVHARTHLNCNLVFIFGFMLLMQLSRFIPNSSVAQICFFISCFSAITILRLSPCEAKNKPLLTKQNIMNRKKSIIISIVNFLISVGFLVIYKTCREILCYYMGIFASSLSMWALVILNQKNFEVNKYEKHF